ncbi:MAG: lipid-A-disaccharide synthase [Alphaproteobacteria bacterium]|nr:lipid-A-disaccharide synthase [Alphaproteobacteria bacterium]
MKIFVIAGESSGDILAADLMNALLKKNKNISFFGVGGEEMKKVGAFKSLFNISDIAVMGFSEIIKNIFKIKKRINQTVDEILRVQPDVVVTVDAPGFNMAVVKKVRASGKLSDTKFVHYVAPQVWAWKEKRAEKIAKIFDYLLCFFPFEPKYFERYGLKCFVVGHTAIKNVIGDRERFLKNYNLSKNDVILTLLPGSRKQMAERLLPIYRDVVDELYNKIPNLKVVIPVTETIDYYIFSETKSWKYEPIIIKGKQNRYDAFMASRASLCISGTAVLELSVAKVPTVVAYKISKLSYAIAKHFVKIKNVTLPNIIMGKTIVPEFIQDKCNVKNLVNALVKAITDAKYRESQKKNYDKLLEKMNFGDKKTPSDKGADAILSIIK